MDTVQHTAQGYIVGKLISSICGFMEEFAYIFILINTVGGFLPDAIGWLEKIVFKDSSRWNWYQWAHNYKNPLNLVPGYLLHIFLDTFTHGKNKRWWIKEENLHLEILGIFITLTILAIIL